MRPTGFAVTHEFGVPESFLQLLAVGFGFVGGREVRVKVAFLVDAEAFVAAGANVKTFLAGGNDVVLGVLDVDSAAEGLERPVIQFVRPVEHWTFWRPWMRLDDVAAKDGRVGRVEKRGSLFKASGFDTIRGHA